MEIQVGLFDHMVLQRDAGDRSLADFSGVCSASGTLRAKVLRANKPVKGFTDAAVGKAKDGAFKGRLAGLPVGGPYVVRLSIVDAKGAVVEKAEVKDVLVGDVWIAAGQSNMQGVGLTHESPQPDPNVRAFYMDDHWAVAEDPIHNLEIAVDAFHNGGNRAAKAVKSPRGGGPAIGFAKAMLKASGVPQGIIASAHGGTSMAQWSPALKDQGGKSLYGANLRRCVKNGGRVRGIIWYQGESDANPSDARVYTERMEALVAAFREDLKSPRLPIVVVQIGRVVADSWAFGPWNSIQDQQRLLPNVIPNLSVVPTVDMDLDDLIHIAGTEQGRLGKRIAYAMRVLIEGAKAGKGPIYPRKIYTRTTPLGANEEIVIEFGNVEGELVSCGRPVGFVVGEPNDMHLVYRIRIEGSNAYIQTNVPPGQLMSKSVSYGQGTDPVCNITDSKDRGLPVMGPLAMSTGKALTPFVQAWSITKPLPGKGKLEGLVYPNLAELPWRPATFNVPFANLHPELEPMGPVDHLLYFRCKLHCAEAMTLSALLGYDGPAKLWVDGRELFHDPNGTNPAKVDQKAIRVEAAQGEHDVVVALGTNCNKAWGIYLRFERLGLTKKQLAKGPSAYLLPELSPG